MLLHKLFNLSEYLNGIQVSLYFGPTYFHNLSSHLYSMYPLSPPVKQTYFSFQEHAPCSPASSFTRMLFLSMPLKSHASFKTQMRGCFLHKDFFPVGYELPLPSCLGAFNHILPGNRVLVDIPFFLLIECKLLEGKANIFYSLINPHWGLGLYSCK